MSNKVDSTVKVEEEADVEISTDGKTIWVNGPGCLARLCKISGEVFHGDGRRTVTCRSDFDEWAKLVFDIHGIVVDEKYRGEF